MKSTQLFLLSFITAAFVLMTGCGVSLPEAEISKTVSTQTANVRQFDLQAHRGGRGLRPENTLPAFEHALDLEVTTLELDLHLTQDGIVVITHDPVIGPNCHSGDSQADPTKKKDLRISQLTLDRVKKYTCDRNPDSQRFPEQSAEVMPLAGTNYSIPTLAELFQFTQDYAASELKPEAQRQNAARVRFNIETKRQPDQPDLIGDDFDGKAPGLFERQIVEIVEQFALEERVTIQSFDHRSINVIPQLNSAIRTVALTSRPVDPVMISDETSAVIWSPNHRSLAAESIQAAHAAGLLVIPWTVNDPDRMESLIDMGVDGLITDFPDVLADILGARGMLY